MKCLLAAVGFVLVISIPTLSTADEPYHPIPPFTSGKKTAADEPEWKLKQRRQALFDEGKTLLDSGHPREALDRFRQVQKLRPHPRVLLLMALAEDQLGHLLKAKAIYAQAEADAREARLDDVQQDAAKALTELATKIPRIAVHFASGLDVVVLLDSAKSTLNVGPVEVDAGKHTIVVSSPGRTSYSSEIDVRCGEEKIVEASLPLIAPAPPPEPPGAGCAGCAMGGGEGASAFGAGLAALMMMLLRRARGQ